MATSADRIARVYLSLGSNIDPETHLREALRALRAHFVDLAVSPAYRSAAVGFEGAAFLNNAVAFDCTLTRAVLRDWLHDLENAAGRDRSLPRYANRALDADIALWCEHGACATDLSREEFERAHVLAPLADLAPDLYEPFTGAKVHERWRELRADLPPVERVAHDLESLLDADLHGSKAFDTDQRG